MTVPGERLAVQSDIGRPLYEDREFCDITKPDVNGLKQCSVELLFP